MFRITTSTVAIAAAMLATPAFASGADPAPAEPQSDTGATGPASAAAQATPDDVIVTGTRAQGITAAESATPIRIVGAEALSTVGQPNLNQALTQLVPSFVAQSFGGDTGNLTLSARLRGLSPNHVLILINGKRRHSTANLQVLGGATQGGAAPDLDLIPPEAIERIEVLEQGAAAQYGSDAIAGVINIILKDNSEGVSGNVTAGQYYKGDGETYAATVNLGTKLGEDGFVSVTGFYRFHDFSQRGGLDLRATGINGAILPSLSTTLQTIRSRTDGFPYVNKIVGDARSRLGTLAYNLGYDFGGVEYYSFGTYSRRTASAYENVRFGDRVIASPVLGVTGTVTTPGELFLYPNGFSPREGLDEEDFASTGGFRGTAGGWRWDLAATYGQDKDEISVLDSANASLYVDTHFTPTDFYAGRFINRELTLNADVSREFEVGMADPLNLAFGLEYRRNWYSIGAGDPGSTYKEGSQSYPGFQRTDAGAYRRRSYAAYVDVAVTPLEGLKLDGAARYEDFSDFGDKLIGKLTARYDFSPAFALRGTISNGFRAPTLAEEFYSATNVSPTSAVVQLPANSSAAALVGFKALEPETSMTYSVGLVAQPLYRLTLTLDAYQVSIDDRIIGSGSIAGIAGGVVDPTTGAAVLAAIRARGNILDPTVTNVSVAAFTNGVNTRTRGVDLTLSYLTPLSFGRINWTLSANYNATKIRGFSINPALVDLTSRSVLEDGSPKAKAILGATLTTGGLSVTARETLYGATSSLNRYSANYDYVRNRVGTALITDLEVGYDLPFGVKLSAGANNLFNKHPPIYANQIAARGATAGLATSLVPSNGANVYNYPITLSPYGFNGGYYYGRISFRF